MNIRSAELGDETIILDLIKELADYEKLSHEVVATPEALRRTLFGTNPKAQAIICEESKGNSVGFALYFYNYSTFLARPGLYLEDLYVKPEYRGKGYGVALLKHLAGIAKAQDCGRMEWSVLKWNTPAIDFYKSIGATPMEEWDTYRLTREALEKFADS